MNLSSPRTTGRVEDEFKVIKHHETWCVMEINYKNFPPSLSFPLNVVFLISLLRPKKKLYLRCVSPP
jgi:hypothetical protein